MFDYLLEDGSLIVRPEVFHILNIRDWSRIQVELDRCPISNNLKTSMTMSSFLEACEFHRNILDDKLDTKALRVKSSYLPNNTHCFKCSVYKKIEEGKKITPRDIPKEISIIKENRQCSVKSGV